MFGLIQISRWQFGIFRVLLGLYLSWHFALLIPYAAELFSSEGALGDSSLSPLFRLLPSPLWIADTPTVASLLVVVACVSSLSILFGWQRKIAALVTLYIWAALFCRNPLIANPSLGYIGLILALSTLIPSQEALRIGKSDKAKWYYPSGVYRTAWFLLAFGYTFSGILKLSSPSWLDGTALMHLAENPLARPGIFRDIILSLPEPMIKGMTWLSLAGEILFLPLSFARKGRLYIWTLMLGMHGGILLVVDFFDLTAAMVLIHLFTFDPDWFRAKKDSAQRIIFYDGECGLCTNSVKFLMEADAAGILKYAPLQGETAKSKLPETLRKAQDLSTVVLFVESAETEKCLTKSKAVLRALTDLGGMWRPIAWAGRLIPTSLSNRIYDLIAANRLKLFPKGACSLPTQEERSRLLP